MDSTLALPNASAIARARDAQAQRRRFLIYLWSQLAVASAYAVVDLALFFRGNALALKWLSAIPLWVGAWGLSFTLARRNQVSLAAWLNALSGLLSTATIVVFFPAIGLWNAVLAPPLLVAGALLFCTRRSLATILPAGLLVELLCAWQLATVKMTREDGTPQTVVLTVCLVALIIGFLLWQFSNRMHQQLDEVQRSEDRFRTLVETTSQIVWTMDAQARRFTESASLRAFTGRSDLDDSVAAWEGVVHPDDLHAAKEQVRTQLSGENPRGGLELDVRIRSAEGRYAWFNIRAARVVDKDGSTREWIGVCTHVESRKRAEASLQFLLQASEQLAHPLELRELLQTANQLAAPLLADWSAVEVPGEAALPLSEPPDGMTALQSLWGQLSASQPQGGIWTRQLYRAPAAQATLELDDHIGSVLFAPLPVGGNNGGLIALVRGRAREPFDLQDLNVAQELARRIAIAVERVQLLASARSAVQVRDDFLSIASHELKTPLTALNLRLELLRQNMLGAPELLQRVSTIQCHVRRLTSLFERMLDLSRIAKGRLELELEEVDLAQALQRTVTDLEETGERGRSGSTLQVEGPRSLVGHWDRIRVEQIIWNLLSNALRYGDGKPITVTLEGDEELARLTVADHGIGIAPADQRRIFGAFERAVSSRNYGGLGLGLYIVRQVTQSLGGAVELVSAPNSGSTFTVTLPRSGPLSEQERRAVHGGVEPTTKRHPPAAFSD